MGLAKSLKRQLHQFINLPRYGALTAASCG